MTIRYLAFLTLFFASSAARANNNRFLPGDAYFSTSMTADVARALAAPDAEPFVFRHALLTEGGAFLCGYAGYEYARVETMDAEFRTHLAKAYRIIRSGIESRTLEEKEEDGKVVQYETNPVRVLFYPEAFEFPRFHLGLQYNEKWVEETLRFGYEQEHIQLNCPVHTPRAIQCCWRDARRVGPLNVTLPKGGAKAASSKETPVVINGKIKAFVLTSRPLSDYMDPRSGASDVLVVRSSGITRLRFDEHEWKEETPKDGAQPSK